MEKKSLVDYILRLKETPSSDDEGDVVPPEVARQIRQESSDEKTPDESAVIAKEITDEQTRRKQLIAKLYEELIHENKRHSVTINLRGDGSYRDRKQVSHLMETEYAGEREYAKKFRPRKRSECEGGDRPCPWVSCRFHLATDETSNGSLVLNHPNFKSGDELPEIDFDRMMETCALDVADRGVTTLEEIGVFINLTRERIRQYETEALGKLQEAGTVNRLLNPEGRCNPTGHFEQHGGNGNGNGKTPPKSSSGKKDDEIDFSLGDDFKGLKL